MYICICNAVNERAIKSAVADGVTTLQELSLATGVATTCGKCATEAVRILEQATAEITASSNNENSGSNQGRIRIPALAVVA